MGDGGHVALEDVCAVAEEFKEESATSKGELEKRAEGRPDEGKEEGKKCVLERGGLKLRGLEDG